MKNRILFIILAFILPVSVFAQSGRIGSHEAISWKPTSPAAFASVSEGERIARDILSSIGLEPNFEVRTANIPNAAAVSYNGKRYILYNPKFISQLEKATGTRWAGISVMAHEIGHHLNGHTSTAASSQPALELEADAFSGFVLKKMGASLQEAQAAMNTLASAKASRTHPGRSDRLASIAAGWNKAAGISGVKDVARATPAPQARNTSTTAIHAKNIIGQVHFKSDPRTQYFVTTRYNLVRVRNNQLAVIGKLSTLNNRQYPYVISDNNTQLLVDNYGNILTRQGRNVGRLSAKS